MHAFFSKRGRAGTKGATPAAAEQCAAHMREKKEGLVSEPWARNAAPSAHGPGRGAASPSLLLLLPILVVLLWSRRPLGPKSAFMENRPQITSLTSPHNTKYCFSDSFLIFTLSLKITIGKRSGWKENGCLFIYLLSFTGIFKTTTCCAKHRWPKFYKITFQTAVTLLDRFCCRANTFFLFLFWCLIRPEQTAACCYFVCIF